MNNGTRRALNGSIHKIREFELEKVCLVEEFDILQIVGEGWFGKILLVEHRASDTEIVLKALPKPYVSIRDFYREFHYGLHLSAHKNIVTTFDVAFETAGFYVFCQEYAPLGDLTSNMLDTGIGEIHTKRVAKQLAAALEHLHQRDLVHRDVKLDNILIFKTDFSRIKLCDFGETRKSQSLVRRRNEWIPYSPPEVLKLPMDTSYKALTMHDIWQFGVVIFICLTGCLPWQKAAFDDPRYYSYFNWYNSSNPLKKQPKLWKMVSSRAQKMFKKFIEPRPEKRAQHLQDISRFMEDRWMAKGYTDRVAGGDIDELCPSMYSFHSDPNEKNILLKHFLENGIETTVDRQAKKQRIRDWIQNSVIEEADEEEENYAASMFEEESEGELEDRSRGHPIDESHRITLRFDTEKHINPRTGEIVEGSRHHTSNQNVLSYDVLNIEPIAPANVVRKYGVKEDNSSQSSTKDSAYGSMEVKLNRPIKSSPNRSDYRQNLNVNNLNNSPSRSLSGVSIPPSKSPLLENAQRIMKTEEVFSKEVDSVKGSSSTLQSQGSINKERSRNHIITENGFMPGNNPKRSYTSMKESAYDVVTTRSETNLLREGHHQVAESPYTSMMNIVQGQIKISPHGNDSKQNIINVSITSLNENQNQNQG